VEIGQFGSMWVILDGVHRLARLVACGTPVLQVRRVPDRLIWRNASSAF
jgi:hypothetical protein